MISLKSFQKTRSWPGNPRSGPATSMAELMRTINLRPRLVFDYLRMTKNSVPVTGNS